MGFSSTLLTGKDELSRQPKPKLNSNFTIEIVNNKAKYNPMDAKYQQMAFQSVPTTLLLGIWSNKTDANLEDSACTV